MKIINTSMIISLTQAINHKLVGHLGAVMSQSERFLLNLDEGIYKEKSNKEIVQEAAEIMRLNLKSTISAKELLQETSNYISSASSADIKDIDVRDEADKAILTLKAKIDKAGILVKKNFSKNLSLLKGNPYCIEDISYILLDNAIEAIKVKGRGEITFTVTENKEHIMFEVKDTGCGISQEARQHIFEPFFCIRPHSVRSGLGLFIAHEIAYSMNANILCESKLGEGSTFYLKFAKR